MTEIILDSLWFSLLLNVLAVLVIFVLLILFAYLLIKLCCPRYLPGNAAQSYNRMCCPSFPTPTASRCPTASTCRLLECSEPRPCQNRCSERCSPRCPHQEDRRQPILSGHSDQEPETFQYCCTSMSVPCQLVDQKGLRCPD